MTTERTHMDWQVYDSDKRRVAACAFAESAAILVGAYGAGSRVKFCGGHTVWREGSEAFPAAESYDGAAQIMEGRVADLQRKSHARTQERLVRAQRQREFEQAQLRAECGDPMPCRDIEEGCRKLAAGEARAVSFVMKGV